VRCDSNGRRIEDISCKYRTSKENEELKSVAVRIRMKKLGRRHRPFFRVCAIDTRTPRDGRVIEELGYYDPMVKETDARAVLNGERIDYWISVGAQPSDKVKTLIKKYGTNGTHLEQQKAALERLKTDKPTAPPPRPVPRPEASGEEPPKAEDEPQDAVETQAETGGEAAAGTDVAAEGNAE
jgi:small subunit ribosomal protein S16